MPSQTTVKTAMHKLDNRYMLHVRNVHCQHKEKKLKVYGVAILIG